MTLVNNGICKVGMAEALSKMSYAETHVFAKHVKLCHNLLGDPEFEMWTDTPNHYSGIEVLRTDNSISVNCINSEGPCNIAYCDNDGHVGLYRTEEGCGTIDRISPNSTVMVYQHNYLPYIAPLLLQNTRIKNSQYVIASTVKAGNSVDSNRTSGNVTIQSGIEYEIEASGEVVLDKGFEVERGAVFGVYKPTF